MPKISILAEGPTESTFIREVLGPEILRQDATRFLHAIVLHTRRLPSGEASRGGYTKYKKFRQQVCSLLGDGSNLCVTTMIDMYGIANDFPGFDASGNLSGASRASALESALREDVNDIRFIPYFSTHEFEALMFSDVDTMSAELELSSSQLKDLHQIAQTYPNPETINGTHPPSHRIKTIFPTYDKPFHGSLVGLGIGLPHLMKKCPRFASWVNTLANVGVA